MGCGYVVSYKDCGCDVSAADAGSDGHEGTKRPATLNHGLTNRRQQLSPPEPVPETDRVRGLDINHCNLIQKQTENLTGCHCDLIQKQTENLTLITVILYRNKQRT